MVKSIGKSVIYNLTTNIVMVSLTGPSGYWDQITSTGLVRLLESGKSDGRRNNQTF